jgi:hypothetical protein
VRVNSKVPLIVPTLTFIISPCRKRRGDRARKSSRDSDLMGGPRAQYPVVAPVGNPFKLCYFPLVTPESLLY